MKKLLFGVSGILFAVALVLTAPGAAKAVTVTSLGFYGSSTASDYATYAFPTGTINLTEGLSVTYPPPIGTLTAWMIEDPQAGLGAFITGENGTGQATISITGTSLAPARVEMKGSVIGGSNFDIIGWLTSFTNNSGYTWDVYFPSLTALDNSQFTFSNSPYAGSLGFSSSGNDTVALSTQVSTVPVPSALILFAPSLLGLIAMRRRVKG